MWRYTIHHRERWRFQRVERLYLLQLVVLVGQVALARLMLFIGGAVASSMPQPPYNDAESYLYAIPLAAAPLLVMLLADTHVAWVFAAVQALVVAVAAGSLELGVYGALSSFAAVYGMSRFVERTEMLRTGVTIAVVNVLVVCGLSFLAQPIPPWPTVAFRAVLSVFGAIQVALLASSVLPALEGLFNTLTDVKLLELSNMNLPLLKQLAVVAPGTYHHSVVIGTLAEKAAQAIGANPLHARVASYYHDVGKMRQPEYFVENQKDGRNPHDKLSPHMSALVLVRHVKDGVAYAQENRLPQPLIDAIPQHHGTRLMKYFYERARATTDPSIEEVKEEDFRYPGPKPQTKEAAIIMLADGVEAMSRLIDDPSPVRLREMIHKNVRDVLEDGQLDQCEITLADLAKIETAFLEVLSGMHHHRIEYPEEAPATVTANAQAEAEAPARP
jgi:putative nucleotidyltransferase with HDIG domain